MLSVVTSKLDVTVVSCMCVLYQFWWVVEFKFQTQIWCAWVQSCLSGCQVENLFANKITSPQIKYHERKKPTTTALPRSNRSFNLIIKYVAWSSLNDLNLIKTKIIFIIFLVFVYAFQHVLLCFSRPALNTTTFVPTINLI